MAQQGLRAPRLRQGPRLVVGHVQRLELGQRLVEQRQRFGQQAQLEIGVGQLLFRDGQVLRHAELLVAPARALEAGERLAVVPARKLEQRDGLFDHRFEHREAVRAARMAARA